MHPQAVSGATLGPPWRMQAHGDEGTTEGEVGPGLRLGGEMGSPQHPNPRVSTHAQGCRYPPEYPSGGHPCPQGYRSDVTASDRYSLSPSEGSPREGDPNALPIPDDPMLSGVPGALPLDPTDSAHVAVGMMQSESRDAPIRVLNHVAVGLVKPECRNAPIHVVDLSYSVPRSPLARYFPSCLTPHVVGGGAGCRLPAGDMECPEKQSSALAHSVSSVSLRGRGRGALEELMAPVAPSLRGLWGPEGLSGAPRTLLKGVTFDAPQGQVLGIAGASGAGKSTLLDAIAGRISPGSLRGTVLVQGLPVGSQRLKRITGYVTQDDALFPVLTPRETLTLSARLRLPPSVPPKARAQRVEQLLAELGLQGVADSRIGDVDRRGISGGERRRVSIGVDLVHDPPVLLLDEPTSGLDSHAALNVVEVLQRMARQGRTVVLTIHQPSIRILERLDQILLLSHGEVVHHGSVLLLEQRLEALGTPVPLRMNPLEYAIELLKTHPREMKELAGSSRSGSHSSSSSPSTNHTVGDALSTSPDLSSSSPSAATPPDANSSQSHHSLGHSHGQVQGHGHHSLPPCPSLGSVSGSSTRGLTHRAAVAGGRGAPVGDWDAAEGGVGGCGAATGASKGGSGVRRSSHVSLLREALALSGRNLKVMVRTKELCLGRVAQVLFCSLCLGTLFLFAGHNEQGVEERMGFMAFSLAFLLTSSVEALPIFLQERQVFLRETSSGAYHVISYLLASVLVFLPFLLGLALIFSGGSYWLVGLYPSASAFLFFVLTMWTVLLTANSMVAFLAALAPDFITANSLIAGLMGAFFLFSGFFIPRKYIPRYWTWMYYLSIFKYPLEALLVNEYGAQRNTSFGEPVPGTGSQVLVSLGLSQCSKWVQLGALFGFAMVYRALCYVALSWQKVVRR